jgi:broad specificity phosphatase PhoE
MRQINDIKKNKYKNIVIVCHGIFMTLFLTKFFKIPIEKFDLMANPSNCEIWILEKISNGNYKLKEGIKEDITNSIDEI